MREEEHVSHGEKRPRKVLLIGGGAHISSRELLTIENLKSRGIEVILSDVSIDGVSSMGPIDKIRLLDIERLAMIFAEKIEIDIEQLKIDLARHEVKRFEKPDRIPVPKKYKRNRFRI